MITSSFNEKSHWSVLYFTHQELFHQHFTGMTLTHPSPKYSCVTCAICNAKRPQPHFTTETVHKVTEFGWFAVTLGNFIIDLIQTTMAISLGTLCLNGVPLASFEKYSCLAPLPPSTMLTLGFEIGD